MKCFKSTLAVHNETTNIWSHLLGAFVVGFWGRHFLHDQIVGFCEGHATWEEFVVLVLWIGTMCCLLLSANYHARHCDSEEVCYRCFYMDVSGVVLQVALTMGTGAALGFRCSHTARRAYTALITGIATSMAILFKLPGLSDSARATSITGCGLLGLIPVFHYFCLGVGSAAESALVLPYVSLAVFFYVGGAAIHITGFPESRWPGRFDYFGQSHNLWHFCVLAGMLTWLDMLRALLALNPRDASC